MNNKSELRKKAKRERAVLDISQISSQIVENIRKTEMYKSADTVMIFYPMKFEINLLDLLNDKKNFYLPRVNGDKLDICPYVKGDKLLLSKYGIYEPVTSSVDRLPDIVFVPALSADTCCNRLGYGGGYYDRLISEYRGNECKTKFCIVIPEQMLLDCVPTCNTDRCCDGIITQKKASFFRG